MSMQPANMDEMDDGFLEVNDLDWFAFDLEGRLHHFATGGTGTVPKATTASISRWEKTGSIVDELPNRFEVVVFDDRSSYESEADYQYAIRTFVAMARKGLYSHDVTPHGYRLIARPVEPCVCLRIEEQSRLLFPHGGLLYADDGVTLLNREIAQLVLRETGARFAAVFDIADD